ncbi:MAG: hypothetical protein JXB08_00625, partial [Bacilli bacterium]|nr:hypothetical protein [Bacilli bacterium]
MSAVLLIAVPLLAAFLSILVKKASPYILLGVGLFNVVLLFFLQDGFVFIGGFDTSVTAGLLGINLLLDTYSKIALWLVNGLVLVISFLNLKSYKTFGGILLLAVAGLNGLLLTNDLFN